MSIDRFLGVMNANGGMSMSNNFVVKIGNSMEDFKNPSMNRNIFEFLCDEAQLPNTQAATGTLKGRYTGEGEINYPHTRVFTEFQLGFQCDANMTPLKFLYDWYGSIFQERNADGAAYGTTEQSTGNSLEDSYSQANRAKNRTTTLNYPSQYCKTIYVSKTELGPALNFGQRTSGTFILDHAWPYAIDAVPLQFGTGQLTKVTAQFYYTKHYYVDSDVNNMFRFPFLNPGDSPIALMNGYNRFD